MSSLFNADFDSPAFNRAYDQMILEEIEKDDKEIALRQLYGGEENVFTE